MSKMNFFYRTTLSLLILLALGSQYPVFGIEETQSFQSQEPQAISPELLAQKKPPIETLKQQDSLSALQDAPLTKVSKEDETSKTSENSNFAPVYQARENEEWKHQVTIPKRLNPGKISFELQQRDSNGKLVENGASIDNDGVIRWQPGKDQAGNYSFVVKMTDGIRQAQQIFSLDVNDQPVIVDSDSSYRIDVENSRVHFTVHATDEDPEDIFWNIYILGQPAQKEKGTGFFCQGSGNNGGFYCTYKVTTPYFETDEVTLKICNSSCSEPYTLQIKGVKNPSFTTPSARTRITMPSGMERKQEEKKKKKNNPRIKPSYL